MIDEGFREQEAHVADYAVALMGPGGPVGIDSLLPVGATKAWAGVSPIPPPGWLFCQGQTLNRADYPALYAALAYTADVTITIASPGVITWIAHGLVANAPIIFQTTGALPTGLTPNTVYYILAAGLATDSFRVSATRGGAAINTSGSQSGVHTGIFAPYGNGDGSTTFVLPDARGCVIAGVDAGANRLVNAGAADTLNGLDGSVIGNFGGKETHQLTEPQLAQHDHPFGAAVIGNTETTGSGNRVPNVGAALRTGTAGQDKVHNNVQPTLVLNIIIWTGG